MLDDADPQFRSLPVLTRSVLHLVSPYLGKGHHVVADCFYSSLPLVDTLAEHNTTYTGTINKNRVGLPKAIRAPFSLRDGGSIRFRSERLMVIAWRAKLEKVPVIITSSSLPATMTQVSNRRGENMTKPLAIDTYNHTMNGVDRKDQHCIYMYYSFVRRTLKWWRKMFYLLECDTVNSYLLYKNVTCKKLTSLFSLQASSH